MATHSSILAWKIPWTEEPGRLQSSVLKWYLVGILIFISLWGIFLFLKRTQNETQTGHLSRPASK